MKSIVKINRHKVILTAIVILGLLTSELLLIKFGMLGKTIEREYVNFDNVNLCHVDEIEQSIIPKYNYLKSLSLFLVNITEETLGDIKIKLTDESGKVIFSDSFPASVIEVGRFHKFPVNRLLKPDKVYTLYMDYIGPVPDFGKPKIYITSTGNLQETGKCISNSTEIEGNIAICYSYRDVPYSVGLILALVFIIFIIIFFVK